MTYEMDREQQEQEALGLVPPATITDQLYRLAKDQSLPPKMYPDSESIGKSFTEDAVRRDMLDAGFRKVEVVENDRLRESIAQQLFKSSRNTNWASFVSDYTEVHKYYKAFLDYETDQILQLVKEAEK